MNAVEGMSDQEIDFWADLFYQSKISGVIEVTLTQLIRNPFKHLSTTFDKPSQAEKEEKPRLHLVYSKKARETPAPKMVPNSSPKGLRSRNDGDVATETLPQETTP